MIRFSGKLKIIAMMKLVQVKMKQRQHKMVNLKGNRAWDPLTSSHFSTIFNFFRQFSTLFSTFFRLFRAGSSNFWANCMCLTEPAICSFGQTATKKLQFRQYPSSLDARLTKFFDWIFGIKSHRLGGVQPINSIYEAWIRFRVSQRLLPYTYSVSSKKMTTTLY